MTLPPDIEAAIIAAPGDPSPYLVAADWLQARGDPQGELIAVMHALEAQTDPGQFLARKRRRDELLAAHGRTWLGGLQLADAGWRWGFVQRASVAASSRLEAQLSTLVGSRAGRYVQRLEVVAPGAELQKLDQALSVSRLPVLSALELTCARDTERKVSLSLLATSAPRLEHLALTNVSLAGDEMLEVLRTPPLATLRCVRVRHPRLGALLVSSMTPSLRALELSDVELAVDELLSLASRARLSALWLEHDLADDLAIALARSSLFKHLDVLVVGGPMTDRGLDALLLQWDRLSRLKKIVLYGGDHAATLKRAAYRQLPQLSFEKRRPAPDCWDLASRA